MLVNRRDVVELGPGVTKHSARLRNRASHDARSGQTQRHRADARRQRRCRHGVRPARKAGRCSGDRVRIERCETGTPRSARRNARHQLCGWGHARSRSTRWHHDVARTRSGRHARTDHRSRDAARGRAWGGAWWKTAKWSARSCWCP